MKRGNKKGPTTHSRKHVTDPTPEEEEGVRWLCENCAEGFYVGQIAGTNQRFCQKCGDFNRILKGYKKLNAPKVQKSLWDNPF